MKITNLEDDQSLKQKGVRVHLGDEAYMYVRPWMNPEMAAAVRQQAGKNRSQGRAPFSTVAADPSPEDKDAMDQIIAEHVLVDWEGLEDEEGEALTYSVDWAKKFMSEERFKTVRKVVIEEAMNQANFLRRDEEDAKGNSKASSGGSSGGRRGKSGS